MNLYTAAAKLAPGSFDHRFDDFTAQLKKLVHSFERKPETRLARVKQAISAHPYIAVAAALGLGLGVVACGLSRRR